MRIIKFRGKRISSGDWQFGDLSHSQNDVVVNEKYTTNRLINGMWIFPETVGQFTGLYDKNGKEIYEGNLIKQINFNGEQYEAIYEVVYSGESFCLKMLKGNEKAMSNNSLSSFGYYNEDCILRKGEVIGNIHDNPELLK